MAIGDDIPKHLRSGFSTRGGGDADIMTLLRHAADKLGANITLVVDFDGAVPDTCPGYSLDACEYCSSPCMLFDNDDSDDNDLGGDDA